MTRDEFVIAYGSIYEHSPWVAEELWDSVSAAPAQDRLTVALATVVDNASRERKLELIRAHPDLAGRAAVRGELTADSMGEQSSAGIDQCSREEFEAFQRLNDAYWRKFGFPFVMAVRNSNRQQILESFAVRLENDYETEFDAAIEEIHKIARLRLEAMKGRRL